MNFNKHYNLQGRHAFLSPSSHHWLNYDDVRLEQRFATHMTAARGTQMHELAHRLITLRVRLPEEPITINMYVNDAIGYRMTPEQPLYFSDNCFGTADTISFRKDVLRIHDLKNGVHKASIYQLMVYDAIFCLEYGVNPASIEHNLSIYQNNEILEESPHPDQIFEIMQKIRYFDQRLDALRMENDLD